MNLDEYASFDAIGLAELVAKGEVKAEELVSLANRGVAAVNPQLNFMVREIDHPIYGNKNGSLAGVPFLIKDLGMHVADVPQTMGTKALADDRFATSFSSELFERFKQAGLTTIGRTSTPEFGFNGTTEPISNGPTRNPWDPSRSSGGSSGGAAAAVAAGVVPIAHGNDGGGSIRIPAASCGLVGLKPSRGRTPSGPDFQIAMMGLAAEFVLSRSVRDTALLLDLVCGPEANSFITMARPEVPFSKDIANPKSGLKIAIAPSGFRGASPTQSGICNEVRRVGLLLADMGHHIEDIGSVPLEADRFHTANYCLWSSFLAAGVEQAAALVGQKPNNSIFENCTVRTAEAGAALTATKLEEALVIMAAITQNMGTFFANYDAVVLPPFSGPPPLIGKMDQNHSEWSSRQYYDELFLQFNATAPFNMTGQPAIALPTGLVEGLPAGVQIASSAGCESTLLNIAAQLEVVTGWLDRRPETHVANV